MPSKLEVLVAANIAGLRRSCGFSQQEFARRAHLSVSYVSMLERCQRSPPLDTLEVLARVLGVVPAYILQELEWPVDGRRSG